MGGVSRGWVRASAGAVRAWARQRVPLGAYVLGLVVLVVVAVVVNTLLGLLVLLAAALAVYRWITRLIGAANRELEAQADRRALEHRLAQSQQLESLGQLAAGVAHDFNNLLAAIMNYAGFVAEETAGQPAVDQIIRASERAARLTKQLLIFGRREPAQPQPLDISAIVADMHDLLARSIGGQVRLAIKAEPGLPAIEADRGQPFFTTKPQDKGTGLGLSTVYGIVTAAGGSMTVESEEGAGTAFGLLFPATALAAGPSAGPVPGIQGKGETVLIVDDEPAVLAATARILRPGVAIVYMSGNVPPGTPPDTEAGPPRIAKPFTPQTLLHSIYNALHAAGNI